MGREFVEDGERRRAVVPHRDDRAAVAKQFAKRIGGVAVVVHDENATTGERFATAVGPTAGPRACR